MYNAKAEEAFTEVELPPCSTTASRCEEDQIPLVKNSSRSSPLYGSGHKYCTSSGRKACFIWLAIGVIVILALVVGVAVGLKEKQKHKNEHEHEHEHEHELSLSVSSCRIPFPGELSLNMIIE